MKFTLIELQALTQYYFEDMQKHGFIFLNDHLESITFEKMTACARTSRHSMGGNRAQISISFNEVYTNDCTLSSIRNTIVHELCHCLKNTLHESHGKHWKEWARKASILYNMDISAYATTDEMIPIHKKQKYTVYCPNCGIIDGYSRISQWKKSRFEAGRIRCGCCREVVTLKQNF